MVSFTQRPVSLLDLSIRRALIQLQEFVEIFRTKRQWQYPEQRNEKGREQEHFGRVCQAEPREAREMGGAPGQLRG